MKAGLQTSWHLFQPEPSYDATTLKEDTFEADAHANRFIENWHNTGLIQYLNLKSQMAWENS